MQVTKSQAAAMLGISSAEVLRRVEDGRLKGRKKTASPFSDWIITLPDDAVGTPAGDAKIEEAVNAALEQAPMPSVEEPAPEPEPEKEVKMPEPEKEPEQEEPTPEEIEKIEEEEHGDEKPKAPASDKREGGLSEFLNSKWWF